MNAWIKHNEKWVLAGLAVISFALHFVALSYPSEVVFDEFHFGPYLNKYLCSGEHYFDVHPPHPKLLMTLVGLAADYDCSIPFGKIGTAYGSVSPSMFRALPAFLGSLLPLLLYILIRQWNFRHIVALTAGIAICFDNAYLVQSRLILLDVFLLFGILVCLICYQFNLDHPRRIGFGLLSGMGAALAIGTKFSGLFCLGMIGLMEAHKIWRDRDLLSRGIKQIAFFAIGLILIYGSGWYLHFGILTEPGSGDQWFKPVGTWWQDTLTAHSHMWQAGVGLDKGHQDASRPFGWFVMHLPIYYWKGSGHIYFIGNPVVWIGASIAAINGMLFGGYLYLKNAAAVDKWLALHWRPLAGFFGAYLPLLTLTRPMFLYHFLTPLLFLIILAASTLGDSLERRKNFVLFFVLVLVGFVTIAPLTYGTSFGYDYIFFIFKYLPGWR